jgi:hypothetical protein
MLGDDDLGVGVDRDLGIVTGDEAGPDRLDTAVGVGEVALRVVGRLPVDPALRPAAPHHA